MSYIKVEVCLAMKDLQKTIELNVESKSSIKQVIEKSETVSYTHLTLPTTSRV